MTTQHQLINGWTQESMIAQVKERNNGTQCQSDAGGYGYENSQGNHCAVGCFIPDGHIAMLSGELAYHLAKVHSDLPKNWPLHPAGMSEFQRVHDRAANSHDMHSLLTDWILENTTE